MKADLWKNIERIFNEAVTLPPIKRMEYLKAICGDEIKLREEIDSMLIEDSIQDNLLVAPVFVLEVMSLEHNQLHEQPSSPFYKLQGLR
jgi:hypothetical protein